MSEKDKEFRAFHTAKINPDPEKRRTAFNKVSRRGLLLRLVAESEYRDSRLYALNKLAQHRPKNLTLQEQEHALYLKLAQNDRDPEIRAIVMRRVSIEDRNKLISSAHPDVRFHLAQTTTWREGLLQLLLDEDKNVRREAEKSLKKKTLLPARPYTLN